MIAQYHLEVFAQWKKYIMFQGFSRFVLAEAINTYCGHSGMCQPSFMIFLSSGFRNIQLVNFRLQGIYFLLRLKQEHAWLKAR